MMPYEKLLAWKVAHELALEVYRTTESWPKTELYGVVSQLRRAALAIPTNLAEGVAKSGPREFRRYIDIALGSASELSYLLLFSRSRAAAGWRVGKVEGEEKSCRAAPLAV